MRQAPSVRDGGYSDKQDRQDSCGNRKQTVNKEKWSDNK